MCHQDQVFEDLSTIIVQAGMNVLIMAQYRTKRMSARDSIMSIVDMAWRQGLQGTPEIAGGLVLQKVKSEDAPRTGSVAW